MFQFTEVIFVDEKSKEKAAFTKSGSAVTFSNNYNKRADTYGLWTPKGVPSTRYKYQMLICSMSFYKGIHFSGYTNCYKKCDNWCGDSSSPYFRTAAKNKSYRGVAFNENGHKTLKNRLITAGIRWEISGPDFTKYWWYFLPFQDFELCYSFIHLTFCLFYCFLHLIFVM